MNKSDLAQRVASKFPAIPAKDCDHILQVLLDHIVLALTNGDRVELRGFGTFHVKERKARNGRNPATGETVSIAAKRVPAFKAGKELRERINNQK